MDVRWKDSNGNILNVNKERLIYFEADEDIKTVLKREEVKKIAIEDGMMHIFRDFENELVITIVIPKKNKRSAVKIFNEYDRTGKTLKGKSNNFLLDLILESSVIIGNPLAGIIAIGFIILIPLNLLMYFIRDIFGNPGLEIVRVIVIGYLVYSVISYIFLRIKRKKLKENYL